jgi:hypothetical protein
MNIVTQYCKTKVTLELACGFGLRGAFSHF